MRVLYFHQYFSTPAGAAGTRSYEMATALVERGHQVLMVCGSAARGVTGLNGPFTAGRRRGRVNGIEVLEFDLGYSNSDSLFRRSAIFARFARASIAVALRERYDVVVASSTPLTAAIPGIAASWLRRKPFVFEVRDLWPALPRAMGVVTNPLVLAALSMLEWLSYKSASRLIGLAPGIVEGIARRGTALADIALIPNGCDFDIFSAPGERWRPEGVGPNALLATFAGAHGVANGLDAVLDAAAVLMRRGRHDIRLLLVGDGKCKPGLERRAKDEGLDNLMLLEPIEKRKLAGLLAGTDVGLQILANVPAFYDGTSPNKFFDYLAAGLPVLINYPGWLAEAVREAGCGWAVPPGDAAAFADALEDAAGRRAELVQMGERARALAAARFDRRLLADRWVNWVVGAG